MCPILTVQGDDAYIVRVEHRTHTGVDCGGHGGCALRKQNRTIGHDEVLDERASVKDAQPGAGGATGYGEGAPGPGYGQRPLKGYVRADDDCADGRVGGCFFESYEGGDDRGSRRCLKRERKAAGSGGGTD